MWQKEKTPPRITAPVDRDTSRGPSEEEILILEIPKPPEPELVDLTSLSDEDPIDDHETNKENENFSEKPTHDAKSSLRHHSVSPRKKIGGVHSKVIYEMKAKKDEVQNGLKNHSISPPKSESHLNETVKRGTIEHHEIEEKNGINTENAETNKSMLSSVTKSDLIKKGDNPSNVPVKRKPIDNYGTNEDNQILHEPSTSSKIKDLSNDSTPRTEDSDSSLLNVVKKECTQAEKKNKGNEMVCDGYRGTDHCQQANSGDAEKLDLLLEAIRDNLNSQPQNVVKQEKDLNSNEGSTSENITIKDHFIANPNETDLERTSATALHVSLEGNSPLQTDCLSNNREFDKEISNFAISDQPTNERSFLDFSNNRGNSMNVDPETKFAQEASPSIQSELETDLLNVQEAGEHKPFTMNAGDYSLLNFLDLNEKIDKEELERSLERIDKLCKVQDERIRLFFKRPKKTRNTAGFLEKKLSESTEKEQVTPILKPVTVSGVITSIPPLKEIPPCTQISSPQITVSSNGSSSSEKNSLVIPPLISSPQPLQSSSSSPAKIPVSSDVSASPGNIQKFQWNPVIPPRIPPSHSSPQSHESPSSTPTNNSSSEQKCPISTETLKGIIQTVLAPLPNLQTFESDAAISGVNNASGVNNFENNAQSSVLSKSAVDIPAKRFSSSDSNQKNSKRLKLSTAEYLQMSLADHSGVSSHSNEQKTTSIPNHSDHLHSQNILDRAPTNSRQSTSTNESSNFRESSNNPSPTLNIGASVASTAKRRTSSDDQENGKRPKLTAAEYLKRTGNCQDPIRSTVATPKSVHTPSSSLISPILNGSNPHTLSSNRKDPRLARAVPYQGRIGNSVCLSKFSYLNVGRSALDSESFPIQILQWNPNWLSSANLPPICNFYTTVLSFYENELYYYNTFAPLHLLSLWLKLAATHRRNLTMLPAVFENVMAEESYCTKIVCHIALEVGDPRWPRKEDIMLCSAVDAVGNNHKFFGRVTSVMQKPCKPPANAVSQNGEWKKLRFEFTCTVPPDVAFKDMIQMKVVSNLRVPLMQNQALQKVNESFRKIVLNPRNNKSQIKVVCSEPAQDQKLLRDLILQALDSIPSPMVLVDTSKIVSDTAVDQRIILMVQVAYALSSRDNTLVLVCTRNVNVLYKLAYRLRPYNPVIAVRSRDLNLAGESWLTPFMLEQLLEKKKRISELYKKNPMTLTLLSSFLTPESKQIFHQHSNVVCLVDEAELCVEVETALPLSLPSVKKVVLIGNPFRLADEEPEVLQQYRYHVSLFRRLYEAQM